MDGRVANNADYPCERERQLTMPANKSLQTDQGKPPCLLLWQETRQLAFAAELGRKAPRQWYVGTDGE